MTTASEQLLPGSSATARPFTGEEYLESLRDDREVWIYGERVDDVTTHPAFRNSARSIARLYDALHDPSSREQLTVRTDTGNGGFTHPFYKVPYTLDDLRASRDAIRGWQELGFGWMGRSPDYKAALLGTLGADPDFYGEYKENALRWYRQAQERVMHVGHAIVHPPVDRHRPADEVADVYVHVEDETDNGIVVSGAKVVATGSALTHNVLISHFGLPLRKREYALVFMAPTNAKGVKLIARASYESVAARAASPFDYPLSSRLDENDSVILFDRALIPWENVLIMDVDRVQAFNERSGWQPRATMQSAVRLSVKLGFVAGLLSRALEITGAGQFRGVQAGLGEIISWRNVVAGLADGMIEGARQSFGKSLVPDMGYGLAFAALAPQLYRRMREIVETVVASGLIYLNSNAIDFATPEIRPYLDRYLRGSNGKTAHDRVKTMKLLWDAVGSEFAARHELYELNYFGQPEVNHLGNLQLAEESGDMARMQALVDRCMADYDLEGWTASDLVNPTDVSTIRRAQG